MPSHLLRFVASCVGLVIAVLRAADVRAQQATQRTLWNSDQVPRDLVIAMFQAQLGNSSVPDLIIGDIPAPLKSKVPILPRARVLGTLLGATSSQIFLEVPGQPDSLTSAIWRELPKLGWTRYQLPTSGSYGGFRPPLSAISTPLMWCNATGSVTYSIVPRNDSIALVRYSIRSSDPGICSRYVTTTTYVSGGRTVSASSDEWRSSEYLPHWPTLYAPPGSDFVASACRAPEKNRTTESTSATIRSMMSVRELLDDYSRQLTESGWVTTVAEDSGAVSKTFVKRDSTGTMRRTTLRIFAPHSGPPDCRDQTMTTDTVR
jgi:hypothetical protein